MSENSSIFKLPPGPAEICFDKNEFMRSAFSVDDFLHDHRNAATLETMRDDLGIYLKVLRSAMIELINDDYADFVNLSSNLVGLDNTIQSIQAPLNVLKDEIVSIRNTLSDTMDEVNQCLDQKRQLRDHLKSVQSLSIARKSMDNLRKLLAKSLNDDTALNPMILERAAMELIKFKYNLQFCQHHIDRLNESNDLNKYDIIREELLEKLEKYFLKVLSDQKIDQLERCLRVFCTLGEYRSAENIFRQKIVGVHMHDVISEVALQNAPQGLAGIYNQIIQFLNDRMRPILLLTQSNEHGKVTVTGFNFIINSFWVEVEQRIEMHMASIFAPGNPDSFYQKYECTNAFLEKIENFIKNQEQIEAFRDNEHYKQFHRKWNLPVYFQIRFQEIGGALETICTEMSADKIANDTSKASEFQLKCFSKGDECIKKSWTYGVYLPQLFPRFFKITLQILARLVKWSNDAINTKDIAANRMDFMVLLYLDISTVIGKIPSYIESIREKIPTTLNTQLSVIEKCFDDSTDELRKCLGIIEKQWSDEIISQASGWTKQVADIPRLYRKTNRDAPTKPCTYVEQMLKPMLTFWTNNLQRIPKETLRDCLILSISHLNKQYFTAVSDVLTSVQKTEESLRRLKNLREKTSSANQGASGTSGMSDDDKIRLQLHVDICSWSNEIENSLGIRRESIDQLKELVELAEESTKIKTIG